MKIFSSQLIHNLLLVYLLFIGVETAQACTSIPTTPKHIVQNAEIVVRATPIENVGNERVKLKVTEVIKGANVPDTLIIYGFLSKEDGFNRGTVPYQTAYKKGGGLCNSKRYKEGGEYLLLLINRDGELTPYWGSGFAPTHEQLRASEDEWLKWVKGFVKWLETATEAEKLEIYFELLKTLYIDSDAELVWIYRFVDSNQEKLQRLATHLESLGYTFVKMSEAKNDEDLGELELQVKKIEKHSPVSLAQRNKEFRTLAVTFGIRKYNLKNTERVK